MNQLPNLRGKGFVIFGLRGSGKTTIAKYIISQEPAHMVYDTLHEYAGFNRYLVKYRQFEADGKAELNRFINHIVISSKKIRMFIIDEANRFCPPKPNPLPEAVLQLNDWGRHFNISCGYICRRPSQLHQDITELADYIFIFNLAGKNDQQYLNELADGLGDAALGLTDHKFIIVDGQRKYVIQEPI